MHDRDYEKAFPNYVLSENGQRPPWCGFFKEKFICLIEEIFYIGTIRHILDDGKIRDHKGLFNFPKQCVTLSAGIQLTVLILTVLKQNDVVTIWFVAKFLFNLIMFAFNLSSIIASEINASTAQAFAGVLKTFLVTCLFILAPFWTIRDIPSSMWIHDHYYKGVWTESYSREILYGWIGICTLLIIASFVIFFNRCSSASANIKKLVELDLAKD